MQIKHYILQAILAIMDRSGKDLKQNAVYDVTGKRELLIDDFLIESKQELHFKQHAPVELPSDKTKPVGHYNSIVKKPDGTFLYYSRGENGGGYTGKLYSNHPGEFTAVAVSSDGMQWETPDLQLFPGQNVPCNTIIFGKDAVTHNLAPFYDTNDNCAPDARYKAVAGVKENGGLYAYSSADGIRWKLMQQAPVINYEPKEYGGHMLDSLNVVFYSETEKCYVMYLRVWKTSDGLSSVRSFAKTTSKDFIHWSKIEFLKVNTKEEHLYISGLAPYARAPQYYVGAATRYFENRGSATDVVLLFSRAGKGIIRPSLEAWIRPGLDGSRWLNRMNYITWGILQESRESLLLYHNRKHLMYRLRTDGFVSLHAGVKTGSFLTKVLTRTRSGELEFNISTSAGGAFLVEVCDENGNALPGYSFADMEEFYGDRIAFVPEWKSKKFSHLPAGKFRLRVKMRECDIYSIAF